MLWGSKVKYALVKTIDGTERYEVIEDDVPIRVLPNQGDLLYVNEEGPYFRVIRIIHKLGNKHIIWLVVEDI